MFKVLVTILLGLSVAGSASAADEIKVGYIAPLTGPDVKEGAVLGRATELAVKQINDGGGINGKKIKLITADGKSTPPGAFEAYNQLLNEKPVAIIAPIKSAQIIALLPLIREKKVPTFTGGTAVRLTQESDRWLFRVRPDDSIVAAVMAKFIKEDLKAKKIGIFNDDSAFGTGGANFVAKNATDVGLEVSKRVQYPQNEKTFVKYIDDIKSSGVEALVGYSASAIDVANFHKEFKPLKGKIAFVGSPSYATNLAAETSEGATDGVYAVGDMVFGQSDVVKKFMADYKAAYGDDPDSIYSCYYDAMLVLSKALKTNPKSNEEVRDAIFKVKGHVGILGQIDFDQNGNGIHEVNVVKMSNKKPTLIKVVKVK